MIHLITCATVLEELRPYLPPEVVCHVLGSGLHAGPTRLRAALQQEIDAIAESDGERAGDAPTVLFGYGLCGNGVTGLNSGRCRLVIPRVDDCVGICLGSKSAHRAQAAQSPGSYYVTRGWMKMDTTQFHQIENRYGTERAEDLYNVMFAEYKRLALIDTGSYELNDVREWAWNMATRFGMRFEEIRGSANLLEKLIKGPWSPEEFVICEPGGTTELTDFLG
jgi:hypothetical protein